MLLGAMPSVLGVAPKPHAVYIRIDGMACGAHIDVEPRFLTLKPGSWVEVVNETPWPHTVKLTRENASSAAPLARSPQIEAGASWLVKVPADGTLYLVSDSPWYYLAGLHGEITVD